MTFRPSALLQYARVLGTRFFHHFGMYVVLPLLRSPLSRVSHNLSLVFFPKSLRNPSNSTHSRLFGGDLVAALSRYLDVYLFAKPILRRL